MIRARGGQRRHAATWPGFVDAMTGLLLVLMFVLTVFTVVQFTLQDQIGSQETELSDLAARVASLTSALGLSETREAALSDDLAAARARGEEQAGLIAALTRERDEGTRALSAAAERITGFEAQVAGLLGERDAARTRVAALEDQTARQASDAEALSLALARAREEVDATAEEARLAAARADALDALARRLRGDATEAGEALSEAEAARVAEAAAAEALRERLEGSEAELTAMTLSLEEERRRAEETLTLLAAAEAARDGLDTELAAAVLARDQAEARATEAQAGAEDVQARLAAALEEVAARNAAAGEALSEADRQAALLATAQGQLADEQALSAEGRRQVEALNRQVAELRTQVGSLQELLDLAEAADAEASVQIESLGAELNTALARVAQEERARAELEAEARAAAEAEAQDLASYRSEFFGEVRRALEGREGVQVVGDRFVFSSEVLFPPGGATLSAEGRAQIAQVAGLLREVVGTIPDEIPWIIRVDGHTDDVPLAPGGRYRDNWELSQARALSVVRQMSEVEGLPPRRLAANGFGEFQPLDTSGTPEGRARNRRIEIKLTER